MNISIIGMGYVGAVCSACFSNMGHRVIGVDVVEQKVQMINEGRSPIVEPELETYLTRGVQQQTLSATTDVTEAVLQTEITFVAVPTPSLANGGLDLSYIKQAAAQVATAIKQKDAFHTLVIRSTVLPGTVLNTVKPIMEQIIGRTVGDGFGLAVNPEFLRESTAIQDFYHPPMTVFGCAEPQSKVQLTELYQALDAPIFAEDIETAEMIKYTCNVWHAVKVAFANEVGAIAKSFEIDGRRVMDIVCQDKKLNISSYYMKPGFAFGGSCLPKDVKAMTYKAGEQDVKVPLISSIMPSNANHVTNAFKQIQAFGKKKVTLLGLAFKNDTDDLRESPQVTLAELLLGKGYQLKIFDDNVSYAKQHGANKGYIENQIAHISSLMTTDINEVLQDSEVIVLANGNDKFASILNDVPPETIIYDLHGFMQEKSANNQHGICW